MIVTCATGVKKVKSFHHRPEWKKLESNGLTMLPVHHTGLYISFHSTSRTWQGFYPNVKSGLAFTFGNTTKRDSSATVHL